MATSKKSAKATHDNDILVHGARTHNLKNVTVSFPRNKLIVVTGVSGSGKSSLTIDTLFAEGQRRYAESLSAYARQFMSRMVKPDVDYIKGLCPAIAIEQKVITRTPRSTVGSMTEIYDYLRLLFARAGKTISPISGKEVKKDEVADVMKAISSYEEGTKLVILVAFKQHAHREIREELNILMQKGFSRVFLMKKNAAGLPERIEDLLALTDAALVKAWKTNSSNYYVLIDRMVVKPFEEEDLHRLADSIGTAFFEGHGEMFIEVNSKELLHFSNKFEADGMQFEEPSPNLFSFNNPYGACTVCEGFGQVLGIDKDLVIPDKRLSLYENAIAPWKGEKLSWWKDQFIKGASKSGFPIHKPIMDLSREQSQQLWTGVGSALGIDDFFKEVEQNLYKVQYRVLLSRYRGRTSCNACEGYRLRNEALYVKIHGKHIGELCNMQVSHLKDWFDTIKWSEQELAIGKRILLEIQQRINTLLAVGLGYLTLERLANTLSGGESQRIQLTRNLGSNLTNSLYILDEPSIGLHSRDTQRLIGVLKSLRDLGNTVVVVEHDEMMMREADHIIDMGPLASHLGGEVVAAGNYDQIVKDKKSLTGKYLTGEYKITPPQKIRKWNSYIQVEGARQHNLKDITVKFPLHCFCVVAGVSGSGKTTLIKQILYPGLQKLKGEAADKVGLHKAITGDIESISQIEMIDQQPIGKSSRSNPVTYIKAYDAIRDLYSKQGLAKMRGFQPKHFSFNVDGGRCDTCKGEGETIVEMQFLADVHLTCESCGGKRFKEEVLEVKYNNASIHDVLEMSVDDAFEFFKEEKQIQKAIKTLQDVGLGYIKLGQSSNTLSGGEAQRVKLASFLGKGKGIGHVLFIFDEPTTGLHFHDIQKLLNSFNALIEQGHSLIVIEHNTDVLKSADWLIELGPEAGNAGGELVYSGIPAELKNNKKSITAPFI
ncbi:MAG: excinuclease ABC subunit A [Sphingobacteriia bacterium 24-36-13]|jgi:excinuclease ABC subunit A|uniref:excinuclease ABC subunit UvrA n=1 Tax=Sediminibacterium sp. TaxID=1917865 RepID=UPI000BC60491|nr:excinuclease ABC subunit UvrA [Sediminibacterium sp.]OYY12006.1 MAG: excinuclease ABC subunit A [Sphingobacteriia bacterium 35-36-14]OYZ55044.1 MAG: excinuclease ABC subunit A [Sphingobacteriia bacterium 24-36-13]OZA66428.1 MAG: excinuclease ABC subunit A [Sphingobacteriia bacterium 39-36-14]HQS23014.1 excinuclease ABC subunit UvrA [Sediminibacterium sp.]HQS33810.1 excinuclease ABC subunit UvrA [Sediminibacterium sp.]